MEFVENVTKDLNKKRGKSPNTILSEKLTENQKPLRDVEDFQSKCWKFQLKCCKILRNFKDSEDLMTTKKKVSKTELFLVPDVEVQLRFTLK